MSLSFADIHEWKTFKIVQILASECQKLKCISSIQRFKEEKTYRFPRKSKTKMTPELSLLTIFVLIITGYLMPSMERQLSCIF